MSLWSIYCRVSTEDQMTHGLSLPFQRESCLKFAQEHDLKIDENAIFLEQYSGWEYDRPLLSKLLLLIKQSKITFVIFTKRDRVARDQFVFQKIKREIEDCWAKIYFAEEKLTGNTAIDSFMGSTLVGFSEYEREIIKIRTHSGKVQHARQNKWAFASVPFGYTKNPSSKELEIYEDEAKIVRYIFNLYLSGDYSIDSLTKHLTEASIPPPSISTKWAWTQKWVAGNRKNSSLKWIPSTVYRILEKSELYAWSYTAFKNQYKKIGWKSIYIWERPKEEWISIAVPPIITKEEAETIDEKLAYNKRFAERWYNQVYLLRWKLMCNCQPELHNMIWNSRIKRKTRVDGSIYEHEKVEYRCSLRTKVKVDDDRRCKNAILARKVESVVIDTIKELFLNPETVFDYNEAKFGSKEDTWDSPSRYLELKEKLESIVNKIERAEELFIDGLISKDRLKDMKNTLDSELEGIKDSLIKEEKYLHREAFMDSMVASWEDMRMEFRDIIEEFFQVASHEQIREIIDILIDQVIISPDKTKSIIIRLRIPFDIHLSSKYYEDEKVTWTDEYGKTHIVMTTSDLVPKSLHVSDKYSPIASKDVEFQDEKKKDEKKGKWWKWWWGWVWSISWAIEKMIGFVEGIKCKFSFESHQIFSRKTPFGEFFE